MCRDNVTLANIVHVSVYDPKKCGDNESVPTFIQRLRVLEYCHFRSRFMNGNRQTLGRMRAKNGVNENVGGYGDIAQLLKLST